MIYTTQPLFCHYFTIIFPVTKLVMIVTLFVMVLFQQYWSKHWDQYHNINLNHDQFRWIHWIHQFHWFHPPPPPKKKFSITMTYTWFFFELILNIFLKNAGLGVLVKNLGQITITITQAIIFTIITTSFIFKDFFKEADTPTFVIQKECYPYHN